ncbi:MAG: tRNA (adenosine(37)-N6)-threonylcarbamoyltransferase complex dimerization subunit type 1 TsaB [Lachnospiraceae bacterium]|nr:tRNA (adenosine(37)-N6)-threonylcarbamoyltransferase complex dimerization subunit type 1 TsaB [Lachnospiraceae bacterium]
MKLLALDTSGMVASVAVWEDDLIRGEYSMNDKKMHSQTILPMVEQLRDQIGLEMESVDAIAIAKGPGSFTGLRIGSATVKGLAYALNKPIVSVPTLHALAHQLCGSEGLICPILDARRNQTYTGIYRYTDGERGAFPEQVILRDQCAVSIGEIAQDLNARGELVTFLGDGVPVFAVQLRDLMKVPYRLAPAHLNRQRAAAVAALAAEYCRKNMQAHDGRLVPEEGVIESAFDHAPEYLRLSQAERERKEHADQENAPA